MKLAWIIPIRFSDRWPRGVVWRWVLEVSRVLTNAATNRGLRLAMTLLLAGASHAAERGTVQQVIDGDTCQLADGRLVRYLGMDAPEKDEPHAAAATRANNGLVGGKSIRLEIGRPAQDRDGRVLAYVFVGDTFVNAELVRQGHAYVRRPVTAKHKAMLLAAQEEAHAAGRGIWSNTAGIALAVTTVHARPDQGGSANLQDEYIVLANRGKTPIELTGWTVQDEAHHRYLFPHFTLPAGAQVTLRTGLGKNTAAELFWGSRSAIWNDGGDSIFVKDTEGNLVLSHVY